MGNKPGQATFDRSWSATTFFRANPCLAPLETDGYGYRGLALRNHGWATPRSETRWTLIHVGSGAAFLRMIGCVQSVMPVAGEIAECTDWTLFDLPGGWRQTDPELPAKIGAICEEHPEVRPEASSGLDTTSVEDARAVIQAREAALRRANDLGARDRAKLNAKKSAR